MTENEKCKHILNYEESYCTECGMSTCDIDLEEQIASLKKDMLLRDDKIQKFYNEFNELKKLWKPSIGLENSIMWQKVKELKERQEKMFVFWRQKHNELGEKTKKLEHQLNLMIMKSILRDIDFRGLYKLDSKPKEDKLTDNSYHGLHGYTDEEMYGPQNDGEKSESNDCDTCMHDGENIRDFQSPCRNCVDDNNWQSKEPTRLCEFPNCDEFGTKRANNRFLCEQHYIKEPAVIACEYLWLQFNVKRCKHKDNQQPNMKLDGKTPGFCTEDKCPLRKKSEDVEGYLEALAESLEPDTHCCECTPGPYYDVPHMVCIQYSNCTCDPKKYVLKRNSDD